MMNKPIRHSGDAKVYERLQKGIDTLRSDTKALAAFRFANRAMATQRVHGIYALAMRRGETRF